MQLEFIQRYNDKEADDKKKRVAKQFKTKLTERTNSKNAKNLYID